MKTAEHHMNRIIVVEAPYLRQAPQRPYRGSVDIVVVQRQLLVGGHVNPWPLDQEPLVRPQLKQQWVAKEDWLCRGYLAAAVQRPL